MTVSLEEQLRSGIVIGSGRPSIGFILEHCRGWEPRKRPAGYRRRRSQRCWGNSQLRLLDDPGTLTYVEGVARTVDAGPATAHAWLVDAAGSVIDLTWERPESAKYHGVLMRSDYVGRVMARRRFCWSLLDETDDDWPLVDGLRPISEAVLFRSRCATASTSWT